MNLRDHLQGVYDRTGNLTPELVVDEARPTDSPLHGRFEWDDRAAGEAYRRVQASELIRSVRIVYASPTTGDEHEVRAFAAVRGEGTRREYRPITEVLTDPRTRSILLADARREWDAFRRKYGHLEEFDGIVNREIAVA